MAVKKTEKMLTLERRHDQELEDLLPEMVNEHGLTETAKRLDLSKATLGYWMLKFQIRVERVALRPNEEIRIERVRG